MNREALELGYRIGTVVGLPLRTLHVLMPLGCSADAIQLVTLVTAIAGVLALLMVPLGVIGIALHVASVQIGFESRVNVRTSIVAMVFGLFSGTIAGALNVAAGRPGACNL